MEELVQFLILSIIAYLCTYSLIILQELGESTLEHPIRATTDKILLLELYTSPKFTFLTHCVAFLNYGV
jgi:hypothetical protein